MRFSRRAALALGGAGLLALVGHRVAASRTRGADETAAIAVKASPLGPLLPAEPGRTQFGALTFRSGLALTSHSANFSGLSALWRSSDGKSLVSVSDNAMWLTAGVIYDEGRLAGLGECRMAPVLGAGGEPLWRTPAYDTESSRLPMATPSSESSAFTRSGGSHGTGTE